MRSLTLSVHIACLADDEGVVRDWSDRYKSMDDKAQHIEFLDQHVKAQYCKQEGHGYPHYACLFGYLEREKCKNIQKEVHTSILHP